MEGSSSLKVLLFPWLAHGHISPFLEVSKALCDRNFTVYLCSTRVNLDAIEKKLTKTYSSSINLIELPLEASPEFPPQYHTTKNIPSHLMPTLKKALDTSTIAFSSILENLKPDLIIYDFLQPWAPTIASNFNIPSVVFLTTSATMTSLKLHYCHKPGLDYPFSNIYNHGYEEETLTRMVTSTDEKDYEDKDRFLEGIKRSSGIYLVKSCREFEGKFVDYLSTIEDKKIVLVGPLVEGPSDDAKDGAHIMSWLDEKEVGSTVFVSFGSEYFLSKEEITEIALGLELSNVNFIWVVRSPVGEKSRVEETLSDDFFEKINKKGLVIQAWAPQAKILTHPNIGGFVSHCGWSSVMEGIKYNVPIIAVPMHIDQPINARVVEDIGVGIEAKRDDNYKLDREKIAKAIKDVVEGEIGVFAKKREMDLNERIRAKEGKVLDEFAEELVKLWKKNKGMIVD